MPASWLVTKPPMPINASVASAVSTANQYNHGFDLDTAFAFIDIRSPATRCAKITRIAKLFEVLSMLFLRGGVSAERRILCPREANGGALPRRRYGVLKKVHLTAKVKFAVTLPSFTSTSCV